MVSINCREYGNHYRCELVAHGRTVIRFNMNEILSTHDVIREVLAISDSLNKKKFTFLADKLRSTVKAYPVEVNIKRY